MEARDALGAAEVEREREREVETLSIAGTDRSKYSAGFSTDRSITISPDYAFNIVARHAVPRPRPRVPDNRLSPRGDQFSGFSMFRYVAGQRGRGGGCSELKYGNAQIEILRRRVRERREKGDSNLNNLTNL